MKLFFTSFIALVSLLGNAQQAAAVYVSADGDPHILTWGGNWFDYMGGCDLVLVHSPNFDGQGRDLNVHIRTTVRFDYSYIESAALQIGDDILEVSSFGDFSLNGVETPNLADESSLLADFAVNHTQWDKKKHTFEINLSPSEKITLKTFKDLVAVTIDADAESAKYFGNTVGLMGSHKGSLLARDGVTVMEDMDAFGQEWQVNDEEPKLFRSNRAPQYPSQCIMPHPKAAGQRRLGETVARKAAEEACAGKSGTQFDNCVFDVMAIGDVDIANH